MVLDTSPLDMTDWAMGRPFVFRPKSAIGEMTANVLGVVQSG